jgi:hypothetical protein
MRRLIALLALPILAAGVTAAAAGDGVGEYYYRNLWTGKAHRTEARVKADTETCVVRAGYPNLASQLPFATRDPAYVGCMHAHGWALQFYTPPTHHAHAGHGHQTETSSSWPDSGDNGASQAGIDAANAANAANAQNAAAQAQNAADTAATQLYMNQQ